MPIPLVRDLPVAGVNFRDPETKRRIQQIGTPVPFRLEPEPTNEFDPHAVKVVLDRPDGPLFVGYIPKTVSALFVYLLARWPQAHMTATVKETSACPTILLNIELI